MEETAVNKLPFPETTDSPDGPNQIGGLAEALDVLKWGSRNLKPELATDDATGEIIGLTGAYQDIPGASLAITPAVASKALILATFNFQVGGSNGVAVGSIKVDEAAEEAQTAQLGTALDIITGTVTQAYIVSLSAAAHTIKMRAKRVSGGAGFNALKEGTRMAYLLFAA